MPSHILRKRGLVAAHLVGVELVHHHTKAVHINGWRHAAVAQQLCVAIVDGSSRHTQVSG